MTGDDPRTARLTFRRHVAADLDDVAAMWSEPGVVAFFGGKPFNREDAWQRLTRYAGLWALLGFGFWALHDAATGAYVGDVGYLEGYRTGVPPFDGDPEIGWSLASRWHGKGLASEAVAAALDWGRPRFRRTVAMIHPDNAPSIAVAERAGFRRYGESRYKDAPTTLWEHHFGRTG